MAAKQGRFKLFMLPWLAHGHISPHLELAKRLANRNFFVYFCSTPVNLDAIKQQNSSDFIEFVEIHLESTPELPPHYHTTKGLPNHLMPLLKTAFAMASPNLEAILRNLDPDLLIIDVLQPWVLPLSSKLNIPMIFFCIHGAIVSAYVTTRNRMTPSKFPFREINIHNYWKSKYPHLYGNQNLSDPRYSLESYSQTDSAGIVMVKSFREIEAKYLDFMSLSSENKVVTTGPLVQRPSSSSRGNNSDSEIIFEWLDKKEPFSTVFVSFGSEFYLSKEELGEIAYGLEMSEVNFIWVIRFPKGQEMELDEALPEGFIERFGEKGKVVQGWAPQIEILGHGSVGGHVSHCGWSSLMESLMMAVPVIGMPMHLDNPLYAILMEDIGVGLEVQRDNEGRITRDEIADKIKKVVIEKTGEAFRKKAKELSEVLIRKNEEEIEGVAEELAKLCEKKRAAIPPVLVT